MSKIQPPQPSETDLPEGWAIASLGDGLIAEAQPGFACGTYNREGQGIGHLRPMNVSAEGDIDLSNLKFIPASEADREERLVRAGDVIFNNTNSAELVGKTACYMLPDPLAFSNHMTRLRCRVNAVEPRFCAMQVHQRWREGHFEEVCNHHVSQASVGRKVLLETTFLLPPLSEQKRIVAKVEGLLERVNAARARLTRLPTILKRFRQSVLTAAYSGQLTAGWREVHSDIEPAKALLARIRSARVEAGQTTRERRQIEEAFAEAQLRVSDDEIAVRELPESWLPCRVGAIGTVLNGSTPSRRRPEYWDGDIAWVSSGEVRNNIIGETRERITSLGYESAAAKLLPVGTVLLAMIGEGKTRGQAAILRVEATTNQNIAATVLSHGLIMPEFLWRWFQFKYEATRVEGGGSGPQALNCQRVRELPFVLAPLDEQREIVRRVEALFALADRIEARLRAVTLRSQRLPQAILARAFRGELVATEADLAAREGRGYESGRQLLARAREEAAQQKSQKKARPPMPARKRGPMKNVDKASLLEAIAAMPTDIFAFDDLRARLSGDYDAIRDILFKLLDDPESGIVQVFDKRAKAMRFRRGGKR